MTDCQTTLPASWYTSNGIYALERRAVFLKSWVLLGAITKFPEAGVDYEHELAQVDFIVRRETDDWRSTKVYNKDGSILRSHLTVNGLLFITLSDDTCSFENFFPGFEAKIAHADFTELGLQRPLKYTSANNWKATVDAYQECLHCAYAHPEFAKAFKPSVYHVVNYHNFAQHIADSESHDQGLFFYLFPNCTLSLYAGGLTCWRINPSETPGEARMEFDYYHKAEAGSEEFESWYRFTRNVAIEDIELCEKAQDNYNVGIYSTGLLNPNKENGVEYFHNRVLDMCAEQLEMENARRGFAVPAETASATVVAVFRDVRSTLVPSIIEDIAGIEIEQIYSLVRYEYDTYDFVGSYVPNDLERRGFPNTEEGLKASRYKNYGYAKIAIPFWNVLRKYASGCLRLSYKNDAAVAKYPDIQSWCDEIQKLGFIKTFHTIKTLDQLIDACTMCIYIAAPFHTAVNYLQNFYQSFIFAKPPAMCTPLPKSFKELEKYDKETFAKALHINRHRQWLLAEELPWLLSFQVDSAQNLVTFAQSLRLVAGSSKEDKLHNEIVNELDHDLEELTKKFREISHGMDKNSIPYTVLEPSDTAVSILI